MQKYVNGQRVDMTDEEIAAHVASLVVVVTADDVRAEAYRRIVEILPEWQQRNLTAQAAVLAEKGRTNWTTEELAAWDAGSALWAQVQGIRNASNTLEAMATIPSDYKEDSHW